MENIAKCKVERETFESNGSIISVYYSVSPSMVYRPLRSVQRC